MAQMVQEHQSLSMCVLNSKKAGFTLFEILIVMAIIGLLMTLIPNLGQRKPRYEREQFIARLNSLCQFAWQQALTTHTLHAVEFDLTKHSVSVQRDTGERDADGTPKREPTKGPRSKFTYPAHLEIKQFIIEKFDEIRSAGSGSKTNTVFFYIIPEGLTQEVTINFIDKKDSIDGKARTVGLVLNPFTAQFKVYDKFAK